MDIAIYGSRRQQPHSDILRTLFRRLIVGGATLYVHDKLYEHLTGELDFSVSGLVRVHHCPPDAALALSIGGDGTFLRTTAWVDGADVPVLGINTGHLGYLSALPIDKAVDNIDRILNLDFVREERTMLQLAEPAVKGIRPVALNEIVAAKDDNASMITASISIDGAFLADYKADGVIVSTPTGSTAYNLSVGGPIVQPTAPVWVISPIAAHSLSLRPLVVNDSSEITMRVDGRGHTFRLTIDGRSTSIPLGSTVRLVRATHKIAILQTKDSRFPTILTSKLLFN